MSSEGKKTANNNIDISQLQEKLKAYEKDGGDEVLLDFGRGKAVETELFSLQIPENYSFEPDIDGFEVACFQDDFQTTPLQITVKAEPLILISPLEHQEQLKASVLQTKGMVLANVMVDGEVVPQFDIPTLGGKQMFFALYHETEVFSLRINFVGKVANFKEITAKILASFHFKDFTPRFLTSAVDSIVKVFTMNLEKFSTGFISAQADISSNEAAMDLCQNYAGALFGCLNVLNEEMIKIKNYAIAQEELQRLIDLGKTFCDNLQFSFSYGDETFSVSLYDEADAIVKSWSK